MASNLYRHLPQDTKLWVTTINITRLRNVLHMYCMCSVLAVLHIAYNTCVEHVYISHMSYMYDTCVALHV